jgi:hypothetical protein
VGYDSIPADDRLHNHGSLNVKLLGNRWILRFHLVNQISSMMSD